MGKQNENIDFLLRRVFIAVLFLFVLFVFKSKGCTTVNSYNHPATIEHVTGINNSAILVEPLSFPNFENSFVSSALPAFNHSYKGNSILICLNNKTNHLLLLSKERFIEIKHRIIDLNPLHIRASLTNEEDSQIS